MAGYFTVENDFASDFEYDRWFVCSEEEPSPRARTVDPLDDLKQSLREIVGDELRKDRDRKSFASASPWMSLAELEDYLGMGTTTVWELRQKRRRTRTDEERDAAFPADHGTGKQVRFDRREVDAWLKGRVQ